MKGEIEGGNAEKKMKEEKETKDEGLREYEMKEG